MRFLSHLIILLLGAALAPVTAQPPVPATTTPQRQVLIFNPNPIAIRDIEQGGTQFAINIAPEFAPTGNQSYSVFLEANGLRFAQCSYTFNASNFDVPQIVVVEPIPFFDRRCNGELDVNIAAKVYTSDGKGPDGFQTTVPATRTVEAGACCFSWGDPHFGSFDGRKFDFQLGGTFWLIKSPQLLVQVLHFPCNNWVVCNAAIAIQHKNSVVIVSATLSPDSTGVQTTLYRGTHNIDSFETFSSSNSNRHELQFNDGTKVSLSVVYWAAQKVWYGDIYAYIPSTYFNTVSGLCGTYNANTRDDFMTANGTVARDATSFGRTWRVQPEEDLFARCCSESFNGACQLDHLIQPMNAGRAIADKVCAVPGSFSGNPTGIYTVPPPSGFVTTRNTQIPLIAANNIMVPRRTHRTVSKREDEAPAAP
ncbi:hypothetical protein HK102_004488, partial [Quaeritorhiza haematococci]